MSRAVSKILALGLGLLFLASCADQAMNDPVQGAWEMQSVDWISKEKTNSIEKLQPGRMLFVDGQYTLMWTPSDQPRVPFKVLSNPTDDETIAAFRSMVYNSGSYTVDGNKLTTKATLARVPGFEGGQQIYEFEIEDDILKLRMVDEIYPSGEKPEWSGKWETLFTLKRAGT